ncbi:glycosyltransferase family 2 protein [Sphingosinicella rhizophila]|uniref:Glycosyltransferase family 2 protein n=1 Tax=Sphingosinicella rhizophila TaxID=3050082 RepID=A0ABU3Q661_9SPHN|nr:glycosyltransferase family 2 protein [Sphingosinicella sp. GR2756]MDT9598897.1 glycosyltransferase family 2 protein [Sphingosinicella sp. GR2756]
MKKINPSVTVVIPAYKAEATIQRAVNSVLSQEGVKFQIIVVIDGLLDLTSERLKNYDPALVRVITNEENLGAQVSRNKGLLAASGDYVMFLDCDDFIEGPMLLGLAHKICEDDADIAFGPMRLLKLSGGRERPPIHRSFSSADDLFLSWMGAGRTVGTCSIMWRTSFLRSIGGWNEAVRRNQDGEMVMRSVLRGARFTSSREGCGVYVIHSSADRITLRPENFSSSLDVGEMILAMSSDYVGEDVRRTALGDYFYRIMLRLYATGHPKLAARALQRARDLGHGRSEWHRPIAALLGLPFRFNIIKLHSPLPFARMLLGLASLLVRHASQSRSIDSRSKV